MNLLTNEKLAGAPIQAGQARLVPIETSIRWQPPGMWSVLLWKRPTAVLVQHPDCTEEMLPIQDVTRQAQLTLLGIGFLGSILILLARQIRNNHP
jgi:hypothetical protein